MDQEPNGGQAEGGPEAYQVPQPPAASAAERAGGQEEERRFTEDEPRYNPDSVARYYEQYYQHPYYGGATRRGWPAWATVLIIVLVAVVGGCGALAWLAYHSMQRTGVIASIPPAMVHTGAPLSWRELDSWSGGGGGALAAGYGSTGGGLSAADFDGDGDEDLLAPVAMGSYMFSTQQWRVYSLAGGQQLFNLQSIQTVMVAAPWDYQADGSTEIAADHYSGIQILNTGGQVLTTLPGSWQSQSPLFGDIDGDGQDELLAYDSTISALNVYDAQGNMVWSTPITSYWGTFVGDVDGDGQDEIINGNGIGLRAVGLGQAPATLNGWQQSTQYGGARGGYSCADLNGDGTDEIISADAGYCDLVGGTVTSFSWPAGVAVPTYMPVWPIDAVPFDLNGDGVLEIAVVASRNSAGVGNGTGLYVFDLQGKLVYYEEFGAAVHGLTVASAGGQEHLCVLLDDRLIVWP